MTNQKIIQAFVAGSTKGKNSQGSLFIEGDTLYSYGHHFPLAKRVGEGFWVNSDRYSVTTSKQQSMVRSAILRAGKTFQG